MSTVELKEQLIQKLIETDNDHILEGIYRLLELDHALDEVYVLSVEQRERLAESKRQIERGEYISDEDLNIKVDKWLSE